MYIMIKSISTKTNRQHKIKKFYCVMSIKQLKKMIKIIENNNKRHKSKWFYYSFNFESSKIDNTQINPKDEEGFSI